MEDLKRLMVLMEEENIKLFNEKIYFTEDSQKAFQISKYLKVVFQITFDDLKQKIRRKKEEIQNFLMEIN